MAFVPITSTQTDAKSPIDEQLFDTGVRLNLDDHEARILALEGGGGSGSGSVSPLGEFDPRYGRIIAGCETNEAILWRRRYAYNQIVLKSGEKLLEPTGFDPGGEDQSRFIAQPQQVRFSEVADTHSYRGQYTIVPQNGKIEFKIKAGENFFGIGAVKAATRSSSVTVRIDGQLLSGFGGVKDENGNTRADTYSTVQATIGYTNVEWFFGLDGKEHVVSIENTDANGFNFEFIEVGFASRPGTYTIDHSLRMKAGRVNTRGTVVGTVETDLSFTPSVGYGHTGAVVANSAGALSVLDGIEPAMTWAKSETAIAWSGAVTTVKVGNNYYFPTKGFLLVSDWYGQHHIASYTSKSTPSPANHSFDGLLWQSKPNDDFTPDSGFNSGTTGNARGSVVYNLWAGGGHEITSSNNKLDFSITIAGTTSTHVATIPVGLYSADLMPLGKEIEKQMRVIKPLTSGDYQVKYEPESQRWSIGVEGEDITELRLLFSTGANFANSIHGTIGYNDTDLTAKLSYLAQNEKQSLAHKVFRKGEMFSGFDPRVKATATGVDVYSSNQYKDLAGRMGFGVFRRIDVNDNSVFEIYPDSDCTGLSATFMLDNNTRVIAYSVDDGPTIYGPNITKASTDKFRANLATIFVSFPRGSRRVIFYALYDNKWSPEAFATELITMAAVRQWHTKPKEEALTLSQSIIKTYDIAPNQLFRTDYSTSYSPTTGDNIDTITFSGSWTTAAGDSFDGTYKYTSTLNDFLDVTFTLAGNGGGIAIISERGNSQPRKVGFFLTAGASTTEAGNRIRNESENSAAFFQGKDIIRLTGLSAGQYTLRVKHEDSISALLLNIRGISIIDTVQPNTGNVVGDVTNSRMGVSYPINVIRHSMTQEDGERIPTFLNKSGYKEGIALYDKSNNLNNEILNNDGTGLVTGHREFFSAFSFGVNTGFYRSFVFAKSLRDQAITGTALSTIVQPSLDGINLSSYSARLDTKAGSTSTSNILKTSVFQRHLVQPASADMSDNVTIPMTDTRGMKVGNRIIITADGQPTLNRVIASVSTNVNITVTEVISGFANYTLANNTKVKYYGFHAIKFDNDDVSAYASSGLAYEPLDIQLSKDDNRRLRQLKLGEVASVTFYGVANGSDLYYPHFEDGRQATWFESSIDVIDTSAVAYNFRQDLKNVFVSAGTIDVKVTSIRRF